MQVSAQGVVLKQDAYGAVKAFYQDHKSVELHEVQTEEVLPGQEPWNMPDSLQCCKVGSLEGLSGQAAVSELMKHDRDRFRDPHAWKRCLLCAYDGEGNLSPRLPPNETISYLVGPVLVWWQFTKEDGEHAEVVESSLTILDIDTVIHLITTSLELKDAAIQREKESGRWVVL